MSETTGMRWHTVRFVDEPEQPHYRAGRTHPEWGKYRGQQVRVQFISQDTAAESVAKMRRWGCDCEQFFQVNTEGIVPPNHDYPNADTYVVCRRMLEMD